MNRMIWLYNSAERVPSYYCAASMRFSKTGGAIIADVYAFIQVIDFAEYE